MIQLIADNIISPLGFTSEENYQEVKAGNSCLCRYEGKWDVPQPFTASLFSDEQWGTLLIDGYSRYESVLIHSISKALKQTSVDITSDRVLMVFSSTKGNIENQESELGQSARRVADYFHHAAQPITVCNACISGLSAQIMAKRALEAGHYDYAIVAGAEVQSKFIVSGFQSFKAVSADECRPFDIERIGLNLGEAAACVIYQRSEEFDGKHWNAVNAAMRNDAYHISAPSKNGEGCFLTLQQVLKNVDVNELAFLNVHGTSTMYNDEMEAKAISRAGLSEIPANSLKGYYGHTMGAAGILEVILSMHSLDDHTILGTRGFEELGVSQKVNISSENRKTDKFSFVKMISGFGGCNASVFFKK